MRTVVMIWKLDGSAFAILEYFSDIRNQIEEICRSDDYIKTTSVG